PRHLTKVKLLCVVTSAFHPTFHHSRPYHHFLLVFVCHRIQREASKAADVSCHKIQFLHHLSTTQNYHSGNTSLSNSERFLYQGRPQPDCPRPSFRYPGQPLPDSPRPMPD